MKPTTEKTKVGSGQTNQKPPDNWRETIESVVVAFVLAFLFRTFEAEAFVIPTGSMAPTLYGQHRDTKCKECGTQFATGVNATDSPEAEVRDGALVHGYRTHYAICPNANCRFPNDVLDREMFAGDRILVNKFPYEFHNPERWDVVVFKFPEHAKTNYIKRLAGLPGEELRIWGGDVWVRPLGDDRAEFHIPRKTPEKQRQLQLLVHDNDRPAPTLLATGWPESWAPVEPQATGWIADSKSRAFRADPGSVDADQIDWIRYSHYTPTPEDWKRAQAGLAPALTPQPQSIKDFYAYNTHVTVGVTGEASQSEQWVGDLTLTCTIEVLAAQGHAVFELVEGQRRYRCTIDLVSGRGALSYLPEMSRDDESWESAGDPFETGMSKPGTYAFSFANVDDRLCVWVDERLVKTLEFEPNSKYPPQTTDVRETDADTAPVGIGARQAKLRVSHLKIERDIYYRNDPPTFAAERSKVFTLYDDAEDDGNDEFLMLGDNSPRSNDSRLWSTTHSVPRHLLTGKAFFVYWPHGVPFLNGGRGFPVRKYYERPAGSDDSPGPPVPQFSVPFYPNVGRMHRIR